MHLCFLPPMIWLFKMQYLWNFSKFANRAVEMSQQCMKLLTLESWVSIFINDLEEEMECSLRKFADDTNLGERVDRFFAIQRYLDRQEEQAKRNLVEFKQVRCKWDRLIDC